MQVAQHGVNCVCIVCVCVVLCCVPVCSLTLFIFMVSTIDSLYMQTTQYGRVYITLGDCVCGSIWSPPWCCSDNNRQFVLNNVA